MQKMAAQAGVFVRFVLISWLYGHCLLSPLCEPCRRADMC